MDHHHLQEFLFVSGIRMGMLWRNANIGNLNWINEIKKTINKTELANNIVDGQ